MISCATHDYIEIACLYGYNVNCVLTTGEQVSGRAVTTETSKDKKEYLVLIDAGKNHKVEMTDIKSMTALQQNPHFNRIDF